MNKVSILRNVFIFINNHFYSYFSLPKSNFKDKQSVSQTNKNNYGR